MRVVSGWARSFGVLSAVTEQQELEIVNEGFPLISTFYSACLDEARIDSRGSTPLLPMLAMIAAINDSASLTATLAALWVDGNDALFSFSGSADDEAPNVTLASFDQGGVSLPLTVYGGNDTHSFEAQVAMSVFAEALFGLLPAPWNMSASNASSNAYAVEAMLANISTSDVARRDPNADYHKLGLDALQNMTKSIDFVAFLGAVGVDMTTFNRNDTNIVSLEFFGALDSVLSGLSSTMLRDFLAWRYVSANAGLLSAPFRNASFAFEQAINGEPSLPAREVQCVRAIDATDLGFAVGHQVRQYNLLLLLFCR